MGVDQPRAHMGAEPVLDLPGLADARGRQSVAQAAELGDLEAHGIDRAAGHELENFAQLLGRPHAELGADLGWRDATQAEHDPAFDSLRVRSDFRVLIERAKQQNLQMQARVGAP